MAARDTLTCEEVATAMYMVIVLQCVQCANRTEVTNREYVVGLSKKRKDCCNCIVERLMKLVSGPKYYLSCTPEFLLCYVIDCGIPLHCSLKILDWCILQKQRRI